MDARVKEKLLDAVRFRDASAPGMVRSLLAQGASITTDDRWSKTVFFSGPPRPYPRGPWIYSKSWRKGPKMSGVRRTSQSRPLHSALLELINDDDHFGVSPLHVAAANKDTSAPDVVLWSVNNGARVTASDRSGRTPLDYALMNPSMYGSRLVLLLSSHHLLHQNPRTPTPLA